MERRVGVTACAVIDHRMSLLRFIRETRMLQCVSFRSLFGAFSFGAFFGALIVE
jgi:hypothetical protein